MTGASQAGIPLTPDKVYLAAERIIAERMYPRDSTAPVSLTADELLLASAERSSLSVIRIAAVHSIARFENPGDVRRLAQHISDADRNVRRDVAFALAFVLRKAKPVEDAREITTAFDVLRARLLIEKVAVVEGAILMSLGELSLDARQAAEVERILLERIKQTPTSIPALYGVEAWYRRQPSRPVPDAMRARLRQLSVPRLGADGGDPLLPALEALRAIGDTDERTITTASRFNCTFEPKCGWEIRRVAVQMMSGAADRFGQAIYRRLDDVVALVRLEAVRGLAKSIPSTRSCAPLIEALADENRHVVTTAIDLLDAACQDRDDVLLRLRFFVKQLGGTDAADARWHEGAHALVTLAKFEPDEALRLATELAERHEHWQVRARAARVAELTRNEELGSRLARDREPNVRTAALEGLAKIGSPARVPAAIAALAGDDVQLVLTAAQILKKARLGPLADQGIGAEGWNGLALALMRLTAADHEPTREARVELLARLAEWGSPSDVELQSAFRGFLKDLDPAVATAAADALFAQTGERVRPTPTRRPIEQPTEDELRSLRVSVSAGHSAVHLWLSDGSIIEIRLLMDRAPLTAARFFRLAESGYYNGLTFHRVLPDLMMAGGSPGANDYAGYRRFWPDEITPGAGELTVGLVGMPARERHTARGQFFITTGPDSARVGDFTVFGRACVSPKVMEGAVIREVTVNKKVIACQF
jgi:peptidyl-prolyl cis-trans isomerase B (cyclophilin B)